MKPGNQIVQNKLSTPSQSTGAELGNLTQIDTGLKRTDISNTRRLWKTIIGSQDEYRDVAQNI